MGGAHGGFPTTQQNFELLVELGYALTLGNCANDDAETFGFDALHELLETSTFGTAFDFCRHRDFVGKRHEHKETAGIREFAGEAWTFGGDGLFDNLHKHLISGFEHILNATVFFENGSTHTLLYGEWFFSGDKAAQHFCRGIVGDAEIEIVEEGISLMSDTHETGVETWHDFSHPCQIDVANRKMFGLCFFLKLNEFLVFEQGNRNFFSVDIDDNFACHVVGE